MRSAHKNIKDINKTLGAKKFKLFFPLVQSLSSYFETLSRLTVKD